jgi:predicted dehydrogenase
MTTIKWGIIGCGNVTEVKSGPAFNLVPNSELVAVMRRDAAKAEDYARRHHVKRWYADATAILNDPEINAIYIATPPASHQQYALAALERGLPVYLEKPMALDAESASVIASVAESKGIKFAMAHYRRALPSFSFIKTLLDQQSIGTVRMVQLQLWKEATTEKEHNWRLQPALSGGGHFHDLAPHQLDIMLYYFGMPSRYFGAGTSLSGEVPDIVSGQMVLPGNILFNGSWNFAASTNEVKDECIITGTTGSIHFSFFADIKKVTVHNKEGEKVYRFDTPAHIQQPMIDAVVKYFRGDGNNPCTALDGYNSMLLLDAFTK